MTDQKESLERLEGIINKNNMTEPMKIRMEELRLIRENPEFNNKLQSFRESDVYCTSSNDVIFYIEVGRLKL